MVPQHAQTPQYLPNQQLFCPTFPPQHSHSDELSAGGSVMGATSLGAVVLATASLGTVLSGGTAGATSEAILLPIISELDEAQEASGDEVSKYDTESSGEFLAWNSQSEPEVRRDAEGPTGGFIAVAVITTSGQLEATSIVA